MREINLVQHYVVSASQEKVFSTLGYWNEPFSGMAGKSFCDGVITSKNISTFVSSDVSLVSSSEATLPQMIFKFVEYGD